MQPLAQVWNQAWTRSPVAVGQRLDCLALCFSFLSIQGGYREKEYAELCLVPPANSKVGSKICQV